MDLSSSRVPFNAGTKDFVTDTFYHHIFPYICTNLKRTIIIQHTGHHVDSDSPHCSLRYPRTNNYINTTARFRANFPPYGETSFRYPTGRFSDGRLIVDFIAEYANLPLIPPYLQMKDGEFMGGANFASAGAGALVDTYKGFVVDLKMQLKQLEQLEKKLRKEMGSEKAKRIIKEGVYLISIGSNDCFLFFNPALFQSISMEDYVGMVIGNITTVLKGIYEVGGRKFAMIGIGQLGCVPSKRALTRNGACAGEANKIAKLHNVALTSILAKLETQLQGFEYSYFDFYTSGSERIQYPSKYGFKEAKTACCGSGLYRANSTCGGQRGVKEYSLCRHPEKYVFFDSGHPSDKANQQYAQLMWNGSFRANFPPYGETFFRYPTGRFSDGRLIVDFIAEYANLPLIPPYLQMKDGEFMGGANFASAGAVALVDTYKGYVVDLKMQLKQLEQLEKKLRKEMGSEKAKRIIKEGVYLIGIGSNDYSLFLNPALFPSISMEDYVGMVIGNITTVLKGIYEVGGRKFAMIGIGKFGCAPSRRALTRNGACSGEANKIAKLHNVALTSILAKLETQLQGFEYSYFDYYSSSSQRIQYPSKYGFKEAKIACCGSGPYRGNFTCGGQRGVKKYSLCRHPEEYVFFDSAHSNVARRSCSCVFYAAPFLWALLLSPATGYAKKHNTLFVFSDSLFDPGNNQYVNAIPGGRGGGGDMATSPPYRETYFKHTTGQLSNGRLVPDFIAEFAKLPILPPYLQPGTQNLTDGANFASSGGAVLPSDHPGPIDLGKQLDYFKEAVKSLRAKLGDAGAKRVLRRAVYLFSIGGNDYFRLYSTKPNVTQSYRREYISIVVGNITSALKEIYGLGGRKIAFQNAGPLGCLPAMRARSIGTGCAQAHARLHN
ncbi:hypothetical protein NL676_014667 [Syzygium grande]|nr:hypothetical protein NL676_014667 [Syzygium grande]